MPDSNTTTSVSTQIDQLVADSKARQPNPPPLTGDQLGGKPHLSMSANAATGEINVHDTPPSGQVSNTGVVARLHDAGENIADAGIAITANLSRLQDLLGQKNFNPNTGEFVGYKIGEGTPERTQLQEQYERAVKGAIWQLQHFEKLAAQRAADAEAVAAKEAEERAIVERVGSDPKRAAAIQQMIQDEADREFARSIVARRAK